ncbi:nitrilase-related carbon-nitrogen hydrolase [Roseibium porphyridii]|uniref:Nitrilase-related carbon-nitrogen hydrolase n=1 Tax=Roseibium porphyridii TaxID=2866279 RepID=A0ABY8EXY5_9HYPH|nr:nitrilase-related carbon-nitrogen hydrolase [Roseibium sp. KMA01]WFE87824.1 nitrilase-related carbon-nitrogen hydrolase [Roseibium sp. KMA01]
MTHLSIALWSFNLSRAPRSVEEFASMIEEGVARAANAGAGILMMPEYVIECCLAFKPDGLEPRGELAFLASVGRELLPYLSALAKKHNLSLLAGTMPVATPSGLTNTAFLLSPDGKVQHQDKLSLTPFEQSPDTWQLVPGSELKIFELSGIKIAVLICLDIEMPALSCLLAKHNPDLVLVPSMTEKLSGYHRVFGCARARAVELMCAIAVCGTVGRSDGTTQNETNVSGAALYLPCEEEFGFTGIGAETPATDGMDKSEPFLIVDAPLEQLRNLRSGQAEVWPGNWTADHVKTTT